MTIELGEWMNEWNCTKKEGTKQKLQEFKRMWSETNIDMAAFSDCFPISAKRKKCVRQIELREKNWNYLIFHVTSFAIV